MNVDDEKNAQTVLYNATQTTHQNYDTAQIDKRRLICYSTTSTSIRHHYHHHHHHHHTVITTKQTACIPTRRLKTIFGYKFSMFWFSFWTSRIEGKFHQTQRNSFSFRWLLLPYQLFVRALLLQLDFISDRPLVDLAATAVSLRWRNHCDGGDGPTACSWHRTI